MSGGSYDYLYWQVPELGGHVGQLEAMAERLEALPYAAEAAAATRRILEAISDEKLADVWRAVEWWDSGDYGEDQVREAIDEHRASLTVSGGGHAIPDDQPG
ncbi:hypothetical protein [Streptomyces sp. NPDC056682]|uniref:hypothetical protein n=1 Tax=Streptomyces sp. NPDC056682 TaxID=3345909 RepID=UPI0036CA088C